MKFGVWNIVIEDECGELRKIEVVSTSGKAAKAQVAVSDATVLTMHRTMWLEGYSDAQIFAALANVVSREEANYLVEVLRHCGVFGEFYGADE